MWPGVTSFSGRLRVGWWISSEEKEGAAGNYTVMECGDARWWAGCSSTGGGDGAYAEPWCSREKEEFGSSVASLVTSDPSIHIIGVTLLDTRLVLLLSRFCNLRSLLTPLAEEKGSPGCQCCMSSTRQCFVFPFYHTSCCTILLSRVTVWGWVSCSFCFWERLLCLKEGDC